MAEPLQIGGQAVGPGHPVLIIAEAGVNHNGDLSLAKTLVRSAADCGANCVKFQTFRANSVATEQAPKAKYQLEVTDPHESQLEMLRKLELSAEAHVELLRLCRETGIGFLSTPYGFEEAAMLHDIGVPAFKVASGQIVELSFLEFLGRMQRPIVLSTGMATLDEVERGVSAIRATGNCHIVLLQCTTNYPSTPADANLLAMRTMAEACSALVGYSDHTVGISVSLAAVALGACVIEKHLTLDKNLPGPDHACSAIPGEFGELVRGIREVEAALGTGVKQPSESERRNIAGMRRSIVAAVDIPAGTKIESRMLTFKRPGTGMSPALIGEVMGRESAVSIPKNALLSPDQLR